MAHREMPSKSNLGEANRVQITEYRVQGFVIDEFCSHAEGTCKSKSTT
ncbi:MAG: hypothetical protein IJX41_06650 [Bacteroidaceae bacterium]|nr:hypothetical protein [Bacteroidaceae bacterium]